MTCQDQVRKHTWKAKPMPWVYLPREGCWLEKESHFQVEECQAKFRLPDLVGDLEEKKP